MQFPSYHLLGILNMQPRERILPNQAERTLLHAYYITVLCNHWISMNILIK